MERPILKQARLSDSTLLKKITGEYSSMNGVQRYFGGSNLEFYDRLYSSHGLLNAIITLLPSDSTKHDFNFFVNEVENDSIAESLDNVRIVNRSIDEINWKELIKQALVFARLYGDAFIICGYSDTKDLSKPLSKRGNLRLDWMTLRSRREVSIDINKRCYMLNLDQSNVSQEILDIKASVDIHPSRVVRFKGVELFEQGLMLNQYYNRSVLDLIYEEFCRYDSTLAGVSKMLKSHSSFSYAVKDLSVMVKQKKEDLIRSRFKLILDSIESIGGIAYDKDNEDVSYLNRTYAGVEGLIDRLQAGLLGVSDLPSYKLFNSASSNSMSTSADAERLDWIERVATFQQQKIDAPLVQLIKPTLPQGTKLSVGFQPYYTLNEVEENQPNNNSEGGSNVEQV